MSRKKDKTDTNYPEDNVLSSTETYTHTAASKSINDMPPEILQCIFRELSKMTNVIELMNIRYVNKSWRENIDSFIGSRNTVIHKGLLTGTKTTFPINLNILKGQMSKNRVIKSILIQDCSVDDELGKLIRRMAPDLRFLSLKNCPGLSWIGIYNIGLILENISHLQLYHCKLEEHHLFVLVTCLRKLQVFRVMDAQSITNGLFLKGFGTAIRDVSISLLYAKNPNIALAALYSGNGRNIRQLGICVRDVNSINLSEIAKNLRKMDTFKLSFASGHKSGLEGVCKLKKLNTLILVEMAFNPNESVINDQTLSKIMTECKNLRNISFCAGGSNIIHITDKLMIQIQELLPDIETIKIINAPNLGNDTLKSLNKLKYLNKLDIEQNPKITNEGIESVSTCPHIKELRLVNCEKIDENVIGIWEKIADKRKRELIRLYFDDMNFRDFRSEKNNLKIYYK